MKHNDSEAVKALKNALDRIGGWRLKDLKEKEQCFCRRCVDHMVMIELRRLGIDIDLDPLDK